MSIINSILDYLYPLKNTGNQDSINIELDECQSILVNNGFKVKHSEHLVLHETVQGLIAEKGNVVLRADFCQA